MVRALSGLTAGLLLVTSSALARDPVLAEALFREGREAAARGDQATACAKYAESQRLDPAAGTLLNLGDCKERLGLFASAWQHFRAAADRLDGDPRQADARRRVADLEPRLSRLELRLPAGSPADAKVRLDDEVLGAAALGVALPVDAGKHAIELTATGFAPKKTVLEIAVAQRRTALLELGPRLPPGATADVAASSGASSGSGTRTAGIVLGSVGGASLGVGIATGLMTIARKNDLAGHCQDQVCDPAGVSAASEGRTLSAVSTVTFIGGLAMLGTGVVFFAVGGSRSPSAVVAPFVAPGVAGLELGRAF